MLVSTWQRTSKNSIQMSMSPLPPGCREASCVCQRFLHLLFRQIQNGGWKRFLTELNMLAIISKVFLLLEERVRYQGSPCYCGFSETSFVKFDCGWVGKCPCKLIPSFALQPILFVYISCVAWRQIFAVLHRFLVQKPWKNWDVIQSLNQFDSVFVVAIINIVSLGQ